MDSDKVLNLFDCLWFERHVLEKEPSFLFSSSSEPKPDCQNDVKASEEAISHTPVFIRSSRSGSLSPNSVLSTSKLQSLFSEITDSEKKTVHKTRRKSVPELEYEELKGFMDMGFVFSEEDRNSSLASIIPALHRSGQKDSEEEDDEIVDGSKISRPYLSEAWEDLDRRRKQKALLTNWKLPSICNEVDMKQNLRSWAHAVAFTVR